MSPSSKFVSVVAIASNDADSIESFTAETLGVLSAHFHAYEVVLVDDGSIDMTSAACQRILERHECVRIIRLSRRFGLDIAVTAGLDSAIGDYAVVMLAATDPPQRIPDIVAMAQAGADIVIGTDSALRRPVSLRIARRLFFWVLRTVTNLQVPDNAATMRLFSRQAINALTRIRQKTAHLRVLGCSVGYRAETFPYEPVIRDGKQGCRPWGSMIGEAMSILVSHSPAPLRLVSYLGGFAALLNVACMFYVVAAHFWKEKVVEGWTTLSLQMSVMFLFLFTTLLVISEYLVHAFEEVKDRPLYHVAEEKSSSTALADAGKRNVCSSSTENEHALVARQRTAA